MVIATPPDGLWSLRSGLGGTQPAALVLHPLTMQDEILAVLELALLELPDTLQQERLQETSAILANQLEMLFRSLQLQQAVHQDHHTDGVPV
jgi:hypothetical protein